MQCLFSEYNQAGMALVRVHGPKKQCIPVFTFFC